MGRIITTTDDLDAFNGIIELVGTSATPAEVDASPLFRAAENHIIAEVPDAALPAGRTNAKRDLIVSALEFCAAWYMLSGGGTTATKGTTTAGGAVKTQSVGDISITYESGSTTAVTVQDLPERLAFFKQQCDLLLEEIGAEPPPSTNRLYVGKTRSRRKSTTAVYRSGSREIR